MNQHTDRYWEGRWRDEKAHNDALVNALEAAADILGDARSGYIGGSSYDEAWDARRADLFKDIQTLVGSVGERGK